MVLFLAISNVSFSFPFLSILGLVQVEVVNPCPVLAVVWRTSVQPPSLSAVAMLELATILLTNTVSG